jgi:hypothetical protein
VATESAAIIKQKRSAAFMVQCMMTAGFFFGTNASRNTAPCNVLLTKRPSLLGGSNRRRDQSRHSESEKQSETIGFNFWRGIGPASFFSSVICDRACEMIPVQKHQSLLRLSFFSFVGDSFSPSSLAAERPSCAPAWRHGHHLYIEGGSLFRIKVCKSKTRPAINATAYCSWYAAVSPNNIVPHRISSSTVAIALP